jgi:hypothetical protein
MGPEEGDYAATAGLGERWMHACEDGGGVEEKGCFSCGGEGG